MKHVELRRYLHLVSAVAALAGAAACAHKGATPTPDPTTKAQGRDGDAAAVQQRVRSGLQSVTFTDADRTRFNSVAQMIQARFSGVQVSRTGAGYVISFSGAESFQGGTEPLVIVDGATMPGTASLDAVNAKDVMKIEVLKNAAASLYGVRGGNGVIIISTQRTP